MRLQSERCVCMTTPGARRYRFPWSSTAAFLCLLGLLPPICRAEDSDKIVTDRPDFVESSSTVGGGRLQLETSVSGEHDKTDGVTTRTLQTPTLVRFGVGPDWELRLETDGYTRTRVDDPASPPPITQYGMSDLSLGVKWHMADGAGWRPATAWLAHVDVPSGSESLRGHGARPSLRAVFEWELPANFGIGVMPGVIYDSRDDGHRYTAGILGVVLGYEWTEDLRTFVEVAGRQLATPDNGGNIITYDIGISYRIRQNVQIDTAVNFGANHSTPDLTWTVGLSIKF